MLEKMRCPAEWCNEKRIAGFSERINHGWAEMETRMEDGG
jgi:hypothetical protein